MILFTVSLILLISSSFALRVLKTFMSFLSLRISLAKENNAFLGPTSTKYLAPALYMFSTSSTHRTDELICSTRRFLINEGSFGYGRLVTLLKTGIEGCLNSILDSAFSISSSTFLTI